MQEENEILEKCEIKISDESNLLIFGMYVLLIIFIYMIILVNFLQCLCIPLQPL